MCTSTDILQHGDSHVSIAEETKRNSSKTSRNFLMASYQLRATSHGTPKFASSSLTQFSHVDSEEGASISLLKAILSWSF